MADEFTIDARVYIASHELEIDPLTGEEHLYLFYDPDLDMDDDATTGTGMQIIRGDTGINYNPLALFNSIVIEARENAEESKDWLFDLGETPVSQNFRVLEEGQDAKDMWEGTSGMFAFAKSMGTYDSTEKLYVSDLGPTAYNPFNANSNSVINTVLSAFGVDLRSHTPFADGGTSEYQGASEFPGHMTILDGSGNDTFTAFSYDGINDEYVVHDSGAIDHDIYIIENGASLILNFFSGGGTNEIILKGYDAENLYLYQYGGNVFIKYNDGGIFHETVATIWGHLDDENYATLAIKLDDGNGNIVLLKDATDLNSSDFLSSFLESPAWYQGSRDFNIAIPQLWDPLVIDLDGDGIESRERGVRYFDLDGNGFAENTAFAHKDDGVLAIDLNENGRIDSGFELFGNDTIDGFTALRAHDSNADGLIDSCDAIWSDLIIWQDKNEDGQTQSDELITLSSLDIESIDVANVTALAPASFINDGRATHESIVNTTSGTMNIANMMYRRDVSNTQYAIDYELDASTLFLPNIDGHGSVMSLRDALNVITTVDVTNGTTFRDKIEEIASHPLEDFFVNYDELVQTLEEALFQWGGVVDQNPLGRGQYLSDGRILGFLEKYFGFEFFDGNGLGGNPGLVQGREIEELWYGSTEESGILNRLKANIFMQLAPAALMEHGLNYNIAADALVLENGAAKGVSLDTLDILEDVASGLSTTGERETFWVNVIDFLRSVNVANNSLSHNFEIGISSSEETALDAAITNSDSTLNYDSVVYRLWNPVGETIVGTSGNDSILTVTADADTIVGLGGADTINGNNGDDVIYGHSEDGVGDDGAQDTLYGQNGNDVLYGGDGNDLMSGGNGGDHLIGGNGNDILLDGHKEQTKFQNLLEGGAGNDQYWINTTGNGNYSVYIVDTEGSDILRFRNNLSDSGLDTQMTLANLSLTRFLDKGLIVFNSVTVADQFSDLNNSTGIGIEFIRVYQSGTGYYDLNLKNYLLTYTGQMTTKGSDFDDVINGITVGSPNDRIYGYNGNDTIHGNLGDDNIEGGNGNDTLYGDEGNDIIVDNGGTNHIYGGAGNDDLIGSGFVYGGEGNDKVRGYYYFNDYIDGGEGNDTLGGEAGNDTLIFSSGIDEIKDLGLATDLSDMLVMPESYNPENFTFSRSGDDLIIAGISFSGTTTVRDQFDSSRRGDRIEKYLFSDGFYINDTVGQASRWKFDINQSSTSVETLYGYNDSMFGIVIANGGTDKIYAGMGNDFVSGGADNDFLYGQNGNDMLHGGSGDDLLEGGAGNDSMWGGTGIDTVSFASATSAVTVNLFDGTATGQGTDIFNGIENILGSDYSDNFTGNSENNLIDADSGDDVINAGLGNDLIYGGDGIDTINGDAGADVIYGGEGADILNGLEGDDSLYGENGNDIIAGGEGNDDLYGGAGADILYGGNGDDTFVFDSTAISATDTIEDFNFSDDKIDIGDVLTGYDPLTDLITDFVQITDDSSHSTVFVDADGLQNGTAWTQIAIITGVTNLTDEIALESSGALVML